MCPLELEVGFLFRLPYKTSDGDESSFMVATGPNVSVNTIIGLSFIKGVRMIIDTVDDVAECKYIDCPHSPLTIGARRIKFLSWTNRVLLFTTLRPTFKTRFTKLKISQGQSSWLGQKGAVHFNLASTMRDAISDAESYNTVSVPNTGMSTRWVPPSSVNKETDDYHSQVLREDGYL